MTLVLDASVVLSALTDSGPTGAWAEEVLRSGHLMAPHHMPLEVADVLRRAELRGRLSADVVAMAYGDLLDIRVDLYPFAPFSQRIWALRENVSAYDAWYVALAEAFGVDLATLDVRISRAPGVRCGFRLPS